MANTNVSNVGSDDVVEVQSTKSDTPWPTKSEVIFIDLMDEQVAKGNRSTTTFKREVWNYILEELKNRTGYSYNHEQLKNKFNNLR